MNNWLWHLWQTPTILWTGGDRFLVALLCLVAFVIVSVVVVGIMTWIETRREEKRFRERRAAQYKPYH